MNEPISPRAREAQLMNKDLKWFALQAEERSHDLGAVVEAKTATNLIQVEPLVDASPAEWDGGAEWPDHYAHWWICTKCHRAYASPTTGKPPAHCVCFDANMVAVVAALAPPAPEAALEGWQPIATAPKDELIDLWVESMDLVSRDRDDLRPAVGFRVPDAVIYNGEICDEDGNPHSRLEGFSMCKATHWMPLSAPPTEDAP